MAKTSFVFPKPQYWQEFEDLTHEVFKFAFGDPTPTKHGRSGQKQYGVDVFGRTADQQLVGVQCKRREELDINGRHPFGQPLSKDDITVEVNKVDANKLDLRQFIVATSAPADGDIQRWVEQYNDERWTNDPDAFRVSVWHWQDYEAYLNGNADLQKWYFSEVIDHFGRERTENNLLTLLRDALSRPAFRDPLDIENSRNFRQAIEHTQQAVDLGVLKDRVTGLTTRKAIGGVKVLTSTLGKRNGAELSKVIAKLGQRFDWALNAPYSEEPKWNVTRLAQSGETLVVYDKNVGEELNGYRKRAIELVNALLAEANLGQIEFDGF